MQPFFFALYHFTKFSLTNNTLRTIVRFVL